VTFSLCVTSGAPRAFNPTDLSSACLSLLSGAYSPQAGVTFHWRGSVLSPGDHQSGGSFFPGTMTWVCPKSDVNLRRPLTSKAVSLESSSLAAPIAETSMGRIKRSFFPVC